MTLSRYRTLSSYSSYPGIRYVQAVIAQNRIERGAAALNLRRTNERSLRNHQLEWFSMLAVLLIVSAVGIPNDAELTKPIRLLLALVSVACFGVTISTGYYLVNNWREASSKTSTYRVWLLFLSIVGTPIALLTFAFGCRCAVAVVFRQ
jgi:hypothetical protein